MKIKLPTITLFFALISQLSFASQLVSYELVSSSTKEELETIFKENKIPHKIVPVNNGMDVYEIIYMTKWHDGTPIKASGFYYVPQVDEPMPLINYHHGTRIIKEFNFKIGGEEMICVVLAADGYLVAEPHYVGLGKGEKFHLYHHIETQAGASIDMMRAIRELNVELGKTWDERLFLTGYSQGGHAAMSTQMVIQETLNDEFNIVASSPMSGAYDLTGAQAQAMFVNYAYPGYLPYLLIAMNEVYKIYDNVAYVFKSPYDSKLLPLYDGMNTMNDINKLMPPIPSEVIKDEFLELFENDPRFRFRQALLDNSTHDWKPEKPMQICYCNADEQVFYKNALVAHKTMKANGAKNITLRRGGRKFSHNTCAAFSMIYTKFYFDSFRKGSKKGRKGPVFKRMLVSIGKIPARKDERKKVKAHKQEAQAVK